MDRCQGELLDRSQVCIGRLNIMQVRRQCTAMAVSRTRCASASASTSKFSATLKRRTERFLGSVVSRETEKLLFTYDRFAVAMRCGTELVDLMKGDLSDGQRSRWTISHCICRISIADSVRIPEDLHPVGCVARLSRRKPEQIPYHISQAESFEDREFAV